MIIQTFSHIHVINLLRFKNSINSDQGKEEYLSQKFNIQVENIYDHVLAVIFRIFGEKDMRLSNEHWAEDLLALRQSF